MKLFDISNWYWHVADGQTKVWSSASAGFVNVDDEAYLAWLAEGGGATPIGSLVELEAIFVERFPAGMLSTYAAAKRYAKETGGIVVGGVPIATDDRSKQMIIGARIAADVDPNWNTQWIAADGSVHPINAAMIIAISDAVQAHVNACFVTYAGVKADIDSGVITTTADIDVAFAA